MSFFSDNTRVATTATPNFTVDSYKDPNVGQYGWTKSDTGYYNQLIQYVDECRKIYESIKDATEAIPLVIDYYNKTKVIYDGVVIINSDITDKYSDFSMKYSDFLVKYEQFFSNMISFDNDFMEFNEKYEDVLIKEASAVASAASAKASEDQTKIYHEEVKDLYEDLKNGQVYRGVWNPNSNAYPDPEGTNSSWDVVLNSGQMSVVYDGKTWYSGDRLVYVQATASFEQIATGLSGVQSVNGKTGAITMDHTDVGALSVTGGTLTGDLVVNTRVVSPSFGSNASKFSAVAKNGEAVIIDGTTERKIYHEGYKPAPGDIGALASTGGTLTGPVYVEGGNDIFMRGTGSNNPILYFQDADTGNANKIAIYHERSSDNLVLRSYGATSAETSRIFFKGSDVTASFRDQTGLNSKFYHENFKPTPAGIGALPNSGNATFNGDLNINGKLTIQGDGIEVSNLDIQGILSEKGNRVYSSGNKPTATDLGFFPATGGRLNASTEWGITMGSLDGAGSQIALEASGKLPFTLWNSTSDNAMRFGWRKADGSFDTRFAVLDDNFICNYNLSVHGAATINGNLATNNSLFAKGKVQSDNELSVDKPGQGYAQVVVPNESGAWHSRTAYVPRGNGWAIIGAGQDANGVCTGAKLNVYNGTHQAEWSFQPDGTIRTPGGGLLAQDGNLWSGLFSHGWLSTQIGAGTSYQDTLWKNIQGRMCGWTGIQASNFEFILDGSVFGISIFASDRRLKTNIKEPEGKALDVVKEIPFKTYDWDPKKSKEKAFDGHVDYGIIAQELEEISKGEQYVTKVGDVEKNGTYQLNLMNLVTLSLKAIQELQQEVADLKTQLNK